MALAAVTTVIALAGCEGGSGRVDQSPPSEEALRALCEGAFATAQAEFASTVELDTVENALGLDPPADAVTCEGDAWLLDVDEQQVRMEMGIAFAPVDDPGSPADDYCDTEGVRIKVPNTGFEAREFDGKPYCFAWNAQDFNQGASSSYVDRSTLVYLVWRVGSGPEVHDASSELGSLFRMANDAVLTGVYDGFGDV